jgi:hypothetical protein
VRKLEVAANEAFDVYRELYYEGGVGSVYFWDLDDGFAGVILLKKGGLCYAMSCEVRALLIGMANRCHTRSEELRRVGQHSCLRGD